MKSNLTHYQSVHISTDVYLEKELVKVKIGTFFYNRPIGEFWVPRSCVKDNGKYQMVPIEVIKARAKHDLKITFDHHSLTNYSRSI